MTTLTLSTVNDELKKLGHEEILVKAKSGDVTICFYFQGGHVSKWASNIVNVRNLNDLTLDEWVKAHNDLSKNIYVTHITRD